MQQPCVETEECPEKEAHNSALENLFIAVAIQLNTSSLYRQISSLLKQKNPKHHTDVLPSEMWELQPSASTNEQKYLALGTFWTGIARMACLLPTPQCAPWRRKQQQHWLDEVQPSLFFFMNSVNQHFTPALLLCSPDCIKHNLYIERKVTATTSLSQTVAATSFLSRGESQLIYSFLVLLHPSATLSTCKTSWLWLCGSSIC